MKKLFTTLFLFVFTIGLSHSQAFTQGDSAVNLGVGFGSILASGGYKSTLPPIEGQFEYWIKDDISIGPFVAYNQAKSDVPALGDDQLEPSILAFGGIVNKQFHNSETLSAYYGGRLGYRTVSTKSSTENESSALTSGLLYGLHIGGRYSLSENFFANAEAGYGVALFRIGVSFKF